MGLFLDELKIVLLFIEASTFSMNPNVVGE